jgi:membrane fusion protein (multidrug efflux system)
MIDGAEPNLTLFKENSMTAFRIGKGHHRVALLAVVLSAAITACSGEADSPDRRRSAAPSVRVVQVEQKDLQETLHAVGSLKASEEVTVRPEISGILREIHFREGQKVDRGDRLFSLEDDEIRQRLEARRAALKAAEAETEIARKVFLRRRELLAENTIARETFEQVKARYETAAARQERLQAEIKEILEQLENTDIRAPITGKSGAWQADPGDFVEVGDPLVTLVGTATLEIEFTVPERYADRIRTGQAVTIRTAADPEQPSSGTVFFVSPRVRENTRDLLLKARIDNRPGRLRPGAFADVELILEIREQAPVLPEEALVPTRTGYIVFVVQDQHARRREVTIGLRRPGLVEIRRGLEPGETVIRSGHIAVSNGDRVRVVDDRKP